MKPDRSRDRPALLALAKRLGTRPKLIRRDACSDWNLFGKHGHAYAIPEANAYYFVFLDCGSSRKWAYLKRKLHFCRTATRKPACGSRDCRLRPRPKPCAR